MIALEVQNLKKSFSKKMILDDVSFQIHNQEIVTILGPNGCGKSTLLKIIAKLEKADKGSVLFNKEKNETRKMGLMFQKYYDSLFPWKTVEENISFAEKCSKSPGNNKLEILKRFNLIEHKNKYPYELSGGLSQLTNFARIYALNPNILLLDEPFSSLDYNSGLKLQQQFLRIWEKEKLPTLLITHSIEEAIFLSDTIILFSNPPTKIIKVIRNKLKKPRSIEQIKTDEFHNLRKEILENIKGFLL
jgi:ABC-type nitrate/sulfonate/bicarbonate transport system ATPase subunit